MAKQTVYFVCYRFSRKSIWYIHDTCSEENLLKKIKEALSINGVTDLNIYTVTKECQENV